MIKAPINNPLCIKCKGRLYCGLLRCPVLDQLSHQTIIKNSLKKEFKSRAPGVFIGWQGYPYVYSGILSSLRPEEASNQDNPLKWVNDGLGINEIMSYRQSLINSRSRTQVRLNKGFKELVTSVALSSKPLNINVSLKNMPVMKIHFTQHALPMGPQADIKELILEEEPRIKVCVKRAHYDTDLKANDAMNYLSKKKISVFEISKLLSAGALGEGKKRKLVPTRWAITATDDVLSKEHLKFIRHNEVISDYMVAHGSYLGNKFTVLMTPNPWSFELFELWQPGAAYSSHELNIVTDREGFHGQKGYASNCGGGYYAARLPVTNYLMSKGVQANVIAIREVTPDYYMPLGVWVVRQAMTNALMTIKRFPTLTSAIKHVNSLTSFDLRRSINLKSSQSRLNQFIKMN